MKNKRVYTIKNLLNDNQLLKELMKRRADICKDLAAAQRNLFDKKFKDNSFYKEILKRRSNLSII